jgi:hypothetical protein
MMIRYIKNGSSASVAPSVVVGRPTAHYTIKDVVRMVCNSFLETITKIGLVEQKVM